MVASREANLPFGERLLWEREPAVAALAAALTGPGLIVVCGPEGVGKTALVRAAAPDGVWVQASEAASEIVAVGAAQALGVQIFGSEGADLDARIGTALEDRILVVDGWDGPLERLRGWCDGAPQCRVVVTTRQAVPGAIALSPLSMEASVALLQSAFPAPEPSLPALARHLRGLPALIHHAARLAQTIGPEAVLSLLNTSGIPAVDSLLEAACADLSAPALALLAVPGVPFDAEDAAAMLGAEAAGTLTILGERGLVVRRGSRFEADPAVRAWLQRRGPTDGAAWVASAVRRVADAVDRWESWGDADAWQILSDREAATSDAVGWCTDADQRLILLLALEPLAVRRGPYRNFVDRMGAALRDPAGDPRLVARGVRAFGEMLAYLGRVEDAVPEMVRAVSLAREDAALLSRALIGRAWVELHHQGGPVPVALLAEARGLADGLHDRRQADHLLAHAYTIESAACLQAGDTAGTAERNRLAARHARAAGDRAFEAIALRNQADAFAEAGDTDRARALLQDALELVRLDHDERSVCRVTANLGVVALDAGDAPAGRVHLEEAVERARRLGDRRFEGLVSAYLGLSHALAGAFAAAREPLDRAITIAIRVENRVGQAYALAIRASVHRFEGDLDRAAADLAAASAIAAPTGHALLQACVEVARGPSATDWSALAATSYDLRLLLRLSGTRSFDVADDGSWFEIDGARTAVQARGALRRILAALAAAPSRTPLSAEQLFAAGWPGERAVREAARSRVYTAIYSLRKLGLDPHLLRRDEGWCLSSGSDPCGSRPSAPSRTR